MLQFYYSKFIGEVELRKNTTSGCRNYKIPKSGSEQLEEKSLKYSDQNSKYNQADLAGS